MSNNLPPIKKKRRRKLRPFESQARIAPILIGLLIALVGVAAAIAVVMAVTSQREEPEPPVDIGTVNAGQREGPAERAGSKPQSSRSKDLQYGDPAPSMTRYSAGAPGYWSAKLPSGSGWSDPVEVPSDTGQLFETQVNGPGDAVAVVHYTPDETPMAASATSTEPAGLAQFPEATVATVPGGTSVCPSGATCTDYLIPLSPSGGYAILVGWPGNDALAAEIAQQAASSFRP